MTLGFNAYQEATTAIAVYPTLGHRIVYPALGLAGEAGEVAEKVKKLMRDHNGVLDDARREALAAELGDVLWYVAQVAEGAGLSLQDIAEGNLAKLHSRRDRGKISGDGDRR